MDDQTPMEQGPHATPPKLVRRAVLLASLVLVVSSLGGTVLAAAGTSSVVIGMLGFELVVLVAAVLSVLAGLGRFRSGYALALACIAGTVLGASVLGFVDGRPNFVSSPKLEQALEGLLVLRVALAAVLGGLAAITVLVRDRASWGLLFKGVLLASPIVVVGGLAYAFARRWLTTPGEGVAEALRIGSIILVVLVLGGFFCASVHLIIRAFQTGDFDRLSENEGA